MSAAARRLALKQRAAFRDVVRGWTFATRAGLAGRIARAAPLALTPKCRAELEDMCVALEKMKKEGAS